MPFSDLSRSALPLCTAKKPPQRGRLFCVKYKKHVLKFANIGNISYLSTQMVVTFEKKYLEELYTRGKANDKKHRFQPHIVDKYIKVINLMKQQENVQ